MSLDNKIDNGESKTVRIISHVAAIVAIVALVIGIVIWLYVAKLSSKSYMAGEDPSTDATLTGLASLSETFVLLGVVVGVIAWVVLWLVNRKNRA